MGTAFGDKLKALREKSGLTMKEVENELSNLGFDAKAKTIYGYEGGSRMPNADLFVALCQIYKCGNFVDEFGDTEFDSEVPNDTEWEMIQKYRALDNHGHKTVDAILELEYERCSDNKRIAAEFRNDSELDLVARNNSLSSAELEKLIDVLNRK